MLENNEVIINVKEKKPSYYSRHESYRKYHKEYISQPKTCEICNKTFGFRCNYYMHVKSKLHQLNKTIHELKNPKNQEV
jgi:hypothetical protein